MPTTGQFDRRHSSSTGTPGGNGDGRPTPEDLALVGASALHRIHAWEVNRPPCPWCGNSVGHRSATCRGRTECLH